MNVKWLPILFILSSCAHRARLSYDFPEDSDGGLAVIVTNNFHRYLSSTTEAVAGGGRDLEIGGLDVLSSYIRAVSEAYGGGVVKVNMGDLSGGDRGQTVLSGYDNLHYDVAGSLARAMVDKRDSYVSGRKFLNSNIIDMASGSPLSPEGVEPYRIVEKNGVKVGFIAVASYASVPRHFFDRFPKGYFQDPVASIIKFKNILRNRGVKAVVALADIRTGCLSPDPKEIGSGAGLECTDGDGLADLLGRLPPRAVDLVVVSGENFIGDSIQDIPVVGIPGDGRFMGVVGLFPGSDGRLGVKLYPPVKLCRRVFEDTHDCYVDALDGSSPGDGVAPVRSSFRMIEPRLFGVPVVVSH